MKNMINRMNGNNAVKKTVIMVLLGLATQIVASSVLTFILSFFPSIASSYAEDTSFVEHITTAVFLVVVVVSPIFEEIIFRALVLGGLKKIIPFVFANMIQAALFGVWHGNIVQAVYAFILGLFIGTVMLLCGSFVYCIVLHMSINLSGLYIDKVMNEKTSAAVYVVVFLAAALIMCLLVRIIINIYKKEQEKVTCNES